MVEWRTKHVQWEPDDRSCQLQVKGVLRTRDRVCVLRLWKPELGDTMLCLRMERSTRGQWTADVSREAENLLVPEPVQTWPWTVFVQEPLCLDNCSYRLTIKKSFSLQQMETITENHNWVQCRGEPRPKGYTYIKDAASVAQGTS